MFFSLTGNVTLNVFSLMFFLTLLFMIESRIVNTLVVKDKNHVVLLFHPSILHVVMPNGE